MFPVADEDGLLAVPKYAPSRFDRVRALMADLDWLIERARALGYDLGDMPVDSEEHLMAAVVYASRRLRRP